MTNLPVKISGSDLWRWDGTMDRLPYICWGTTLVGIKYGIDSAVSWLIFNRPWSFWYYISPGQSIDILNLTAADSVYFLTMLTLALPFIWAGVVMTMRRLRAANLPVWLAKLFFVPFVNGLLFAILCLLPSQEPSDSLKLTDREHGVEPEPAKLPGSTPAIAQSARTPKELANLARGAQLSAPAHISREPLDMAEAALSIVSTTPIAALIAFIGATMLQTYGLGLFIGVPFIHGLAVATIYGRRRPRPLSQCIVVAAVACALLGVTIFFWAWEGLVCLAMASPIALVLSMMGAFLGYEIQKRPAIPGDRLSVLIAVSISFPILMGAEYAAGVKAPTHAVCSTVVVAAAPERVWNYVIAFPELPPPDDWFFHLGVAYPKGATISGSGPGAVRKCVFSTGAFIEPIKVWDAPKLLQFGVQAQPPNMQELSWRREIHPAHLKGYLEVEGGQFLLQPQPQPNGQIFTKLEGTTWYRNRMWPQLYWRLWSDDIIHRIHLRVLKHVKTLAESPQS